MSGSGRPVVVGVDGSASGLRAVRWAAGQAARRDTGLRLVHAAAAPTGYPGGFVDAQVLRTALAEQGRAALARAAETAAAAVPGLGTVEVLTEAPASAALVAESRDADLVVLGSRGLGGFTGLLVGSTAVEVTAHARCAVAVVRAASDDQEPPTTGPVVVGVDGTPVGEAAIAFAFAEAAERGADLLAVHAWSDLLLEIAFVGGAEALDFSRLAERAEELLGERLAGWSPTYPDVRVTREVVRGRPTQALLDRARNAQLVVVGSRGRGGFRGLLLGSTSHHLIHHAPCPVVVVRPEPDA